MEDNHILLMRVLKVHYKDRLNILDDALKVIKEYSNVPDSTQSEYEQTTVTLQNMLNDLPAEILKYFLTMVPLPKNRDNLAPNNHESIDIRSILISYLNKDVRPVVAAAPKIEIKKEGTPSAPAESMFKNTVKSLKRPSGRYRRKTTNKGPMECKKLLDLCAEYVVQHQVTLNQDYHSMKEKVWKLVNSNRYNGEMLEKLYGIIRDLNKKIKWMRLLDSDEITDEIIREHYLDEEIFIKERKMDELLKEDPFKVGPELRAAIDAFVTKPLTF